MKELSSNKKIICRIIGVMSGTSLDGLDIAACTFYDNDGTISFDINEAITLDYPNEWKKKLNDAKIIPSEDLLMVHNEYGIFIGEAINNFLKSTGFQANLVASHGHTIFHQPDKGFTFQLGNGATIVLASGITTISDFRTMDVALGGQGAPLVPIGDRDLFGDFDYCLNLGGFANISYEQENRRIAFDICPVNYVLNELAQQLGRQFDKDGELGKQGELNHSLYEKLNQIGFYNIDPPKSLGSEWVETNFYPILKNSDDTIINKLRTVYDHIAFQISNVIKQKGKVLVTGGGAKNKYLMDLIRQFTSSEIFIPDSKLVDYKEALIFAYLGLLRWQNKINCLSSVTGAKKDSCTGTIHIS